MLFQPPYAEGIAAPRRGIVLLVVISLLTIFAVAGIAFVYYADSEAAASKANREGTVYKQPDIDPELLFAAFMQQFLFDGPDDETGVYSAMRGYSLMRSMYGYNDAFPNVVPFNGTGPLAEAFTLNLGGKPAVAQALHGQDMVNFQFHRYNTGQAGATGTINWVVPAGMPAVFNGVAKPLAQQLTYQDVLRDPERLGTRNAGLAPTANNPNFSDLTKRGPFLGGFNVPYTYADRNNLFLAAIKPDGSVLLPSFLRLWQSPLNIESGTHGASEAGPIATIRTTQAHGYWVGQTVMISGVAPQTGYNGIFKIRSVPTTTTFTYTNPNTGLTPSGGGTVAVRGTTLDPADPNWLDASKPFLKYLLMRPRPIDQLLPREMTLLAAKPGAVVPGNPASWLQNVPAIIGRGVFPPPADSGGDVQNAKGWTKGNDSFWIYTGSPVMKLADGRQFTMLYAPLIVDLDGRVNVNVHGNIHGQVVLGGTPYLAHRSNQGWGPWEVNLGQVMGLGGVEWTNLFTGVDVPGTRPAPAARNIRVVGRYGTDLVLVRGAAGLVRASTATAPAFGPTGSPAGIGWPNVRAPRIFSQIDFDATNNGIGGGPSSAMLLSSAFPSIPSCFPWFQPPRVPPAPFPARDGSYSNESALPKPPALIPALFPDSERLYHPAAYNPFSPTYLSNATVPPGGYDRRFATSEMEALMRRGDTGTEALTSDLLRLCPLNFGNGRIRQMVTTDSYDLDVPGLTPWIYNLPIDPYTFPQYASDVFAVPGSGQSTVATIRPVKPGPAGATQVGTTVTIRTTAPNSLIGLKAGQVVFISGVTALGYNGRFTVTAVNAGTNSFTYTNLTTKLPASGGGSVLVGPDIQFPDFSAAYPWNQGWNTPGEFGSSTLDPWRWQSINNIVKPTSNSSTTDATNAIITAATEAGKTVTIRTNGPHGFTVGQLAIVSGVPVAGYNGMFFVTSVPGATSFTYNLAAAGLKASAGGSVYDPSTILQRVNLNRPLTPYPSMDPSTPPTAGPLMRFDDSSKPAVIAQFMAAQKDRQNMANDIYNRLLLVTGLPRTINVMIASAPIGATEKGTTVTIVTTRPHGLSVGQTVTIAGVAVNGYNGTFTVASVNGNTFTYTSTTPGLLPSGGGNFGPNPDLRIRRWLAQLAVNMVDYIDEDDISTPFNFYTAADALNSNDTGYDPGAQLENDPNKELPNYWVFGTELPRVVLNEVLVEAKDVMSQDKAPPTNYPSQTVNVFAELFNTMPAPTNFQGNKYPNNVQPQDSLAVPLFMNKIAASGSTSANKGNGYAPYQLAAGLQVLPKDYNVLGKLSVNQLNSVIATQDSDFDNTQNKKIGTVANPTAAKLPSTFPQITPQQYFLVTSGQEGRGTIKVPTKKPPKPGVPGNTPWLQTTNLQQAGVTKLPKVNTAASGVAATERNNGLTVALRRLANPHLPYEPNAFRFVGGSKVANPWYNPYVTIDFIASNPILGTVPATQQVSSRSRTQPYGGFYKAPTPVKLGAYSVDTTNSPVIDETSLTAVANTSHSFGQANGVKKTSFDWLVHLDRKLISPMELLHVSAFQPHQLTQRFLTGTNTAAYPPVPTSTMFQQYAPWTANPNDTTNYMNSSTLATVNYPLYRVFEFLETSSYQAGVASVTLTAAGAVKGGPGAPANDYPGLAGNVRPTDPVSGQPAMHGITAGGVYWEIKPGMQLLIDAGTPNEELVTVTTATANRFRANFRINHPAPTVTVPLTQARLPGKININTIWEPEIFQAICDAQPNLGSPTSPNGSGFNPAAVQTMFNNLLAKRTPNGIPGPQDRPFRPFTTGYIAPADTQYPNGLSVQDTLLGAATLTSSSPALQITGSHPYQTTELLTKVFNNFSVRSNTFAVWVTVGFFEVPPGGELFNPPILGAELGLAQNRNIRHRMFAIVDRTNPWYATTAAQAIAAGSPSTVTPTVASEILQVGDLLTVDSGANQETVAVTGVNYGASPPTFTANFTKAHAAGCVILGKGNPGPRTGGFNPQTGVFNPPTGVLNPHAHPDIIRHFSIIE